MDSLIALPFLCLVCGHAGSVRFQDDAWRRLDSGCEELIVGLAFADAMHGIAVGGDREEGTPALLLKTDDAGESWRRIDLDLETRLYAVHFPTPRTGYAVGLRGTVLKTTDGGESWSRLDCGVEGWLAAVFFTGAETGFVAGNDLILKTTDGGASWRPVVDDPSGPDENASLRDLFFASPATGYAVGDMGLILRTADAGESWERVESGVDAWLRAVHFVDERTGFVAGSGVLLATSDGGATWRRLAAHPREKLNDVLFLDARNGFTTTMEGRIRRTRDGGATWELAFDNDHRAMTGLQSTRAEVVYAAGDAGTLLRLAR